MQSLIANDCPERAKAWTAAFAGMTSLKNLIPAKVEIHQ